MNFFGICMGLITLIVIAEFKHQAVRAKLGWFPYRPKKLKLPFAATIEQWKAQHL